MTVSDANGLALFTLTIAGIEAPAIRHTRIVST